MRPANSAAAAAGMPSVGVHTPRGPMPITPASPSSSTSDASDYATRRVPLGSTGSDLADTVDESVDLLVRRVARAAGPDDTVVPAREPLDQRGRIEVAVRHEHRALGQSGGNVAA